jgi:hypothetical protein
MQDPTETNPPSSVNPAGRDRNSQPYIGGADSVDKTTYSGDAHGTDTADAAKSHGRYTASVAHNGGVGWLGWLALGLAALALIAYAVGLFR